MNAARGIRFPAPAVLVSSMLLAGALPVPLTPEPVQQRPVTLRIGLVSTGNFLSLPPVFMADTPEAWVMSQVYGPGLVWAPPEGSELPRFALAEREVPSTTRGRLYFDVRADVKFQNGMGLGLELYKTTYELLRRLANEGVLRIDPAFTRLQEVELTPDLEGRYQRIGILMDQQGLESSAWRIATVPPLPPRLLRAMNRRPSRAVLDTLSVMDPGGLGPYEFSLPDYAEEEEGGSRRPSVVLNASPNYFEGVPEFTRVEIYIYPTDRRLIQALVTGEVDAARLPDWPSHQAASSQVSSTRQHILRKYPRRDHFYFLAFNTAYGPLQNAVLRRAMEMAIDRSRLIAGPPASVVMNDVPRQPASTPAGVAGRSALQALNLLQTEIGHRIRGGVLTDRSRRPVEEFTLFYPNRTEHYEEMARRITLNLADIGIRIRPQPVSPDELRNRLADGEYQMAISEMTMPSTPEALRYYFHSSNAASGVNFTRYSNLSFDTTIDGYLDPPPGIFRSTREAFIRDAWQKIQDDMPLITLYFQIDEFWAFNGTVLDVNTVGRTEDRLEPLAHWKRRR